MEFKTVSVIAISGLGLLAALVSAPASATAQDAITVASLSADFALVATEADCVAEVVAARVYGLSYIQIAHAFGRASVAVVDEDVLDGCFMTFKAISCTCGCDLDNAYSSGRTSVVLTGGGPPPFNPPSGGSSGGGGSNNK